MRKFIRKIGVSLIRFQNFPVKLDIHLCESTLLQKNIFYESTHHQKMSIN